MKILSTAVNAFLLAVVAVFLVANRKPVAISLDPVSVANPVISSPAAPLWVWLALFLLIGFFLGATGMWMSGRTKRERARVDRQAVKELRRENEILSARSPSEAPLIVADQ